MYEERGSLSAMPYKDPERQRRAQREHYELNKSSYRERSAWSRRQNMQRLAELKESSPCIDCDKQYPYYVMQFDHTSDNKTAGVSRLARTASWATVLAEIEKCDLVCANCHAIRSWKRLNPEITALPEILLEEEEERLHE